MESGQITRLLPALKAGDQQAITQIVEAFYDPIVRIVHSKLPANVRRFADGEDVANSALMSFVQRASQGQFPQLECRDDVWKLLVTISCRKAGKLLKAATTQKKGGGHVRGESIVADIECNKSGGLDQLAQARVTESSLDVEDCADRILRFLEQIDPVLRDIALWKSDGKTDQWIANHLDCSTKSIQRKTKRLRLAIMGWKENL